MDRTLLIGLDGATFDDPRPVHGARAACRSCGRSSERGARAPLRSIIAAAHAAGLDVADDRQAPRPARRLRLLPEGGRRTAIYFRFATSQDVRSATIWSLASDAGRRVISLNFPLMFPPPAVDGCVVPGGMMPWRQLRLGCHPAGPVRPPQGSCRASSRARCSTWSSRSRPIEGCPDDEQARLGRAPHPARAALAGGRAPPDDARSRPTSPASCSTASTSSSTSAGASSTRPAARREPTAWERRMIERCEALLRVRSTRSSASSSRWPARRRPSCSPPTTASARRATSSTSTPGSSSEGYLAWADGDGARRRRRRPRSASPRSPATCARSTGARTVAYAATPS